MGNQIKIILIFLLLLIAFPNQRVFPQQGAFGVVVDIKDKENSSEGILLKLDSFVKGKLRKLSNVKIVDEDGNFKLKILVRNIYSGKDFVGYSLTSQILIPLHCDGDKNYTLIFTGTNISNEQELNLTADSIVASFDNVLDGFRTKKKK